MLRTPPDFAALIEAMASVDADCVLIGGLAMIAHGSDYATSDVDFAYKRDRENAKRIAAALGPFHPRPEGLDPSLPYVWDAVTIWNSNLLTLSSDKGSIDLLGETPGVGSYSELRERAAELELFGRLVKVASLEDLIRMKEAAGRTKDQLHLLELKALLALREGGDLGGKHSRQ